MASALEHKVLAINEWLHHTEDLEAMFEDDDIVESALRGAAGILRSRRDDLKGAARKLRSESNGLNGQGS